MKYKDSVIFGCLLMCGLGASPLAQACSTDGWLGGVTGLNTTLFVGSPNSSPPNATPRFSELCGMRVTGTGSVRDLSPDHTRIRVRFYVLSQLAGTGETVLFRAYANETDTGSLFEIRRDGTNLEFDTTAAGGGSTSVAAPTGWLAIEFDWQSGGSMSIWVNADANTAPTTATVAAGTGTVDSARLGLIAGLGGFTGAGVFDAYEAHSTTPVGLLLNGDANDSGTITIADVTRIGSELNGSLSPGQPDCNRSGGVTIADVTCIGGLLP